MICLFFLHDKIKITCAGDLKLGQMLMLFIECIYVWCVSEL